VKRPVAAFADERLTDAPYDLFAGRLREPAAFKHLAFAASRMALEETPDELRLVWARRRLAAEEQGLLILRRDERGAFLRIEGQVRGWGCFLVFGILRWHADDLLERLVEEL
jgi:hypothetical protein